MRELVVDYEGGRLDAWLSVALGVARSEAARLIEGGAVLVDGRPSAKSTRVRVGQVIAVGEPSTGGRRVEATGIEIRFEDENLAVVAKPAGLVVHPAPGTTSETLVEGLAKRMSLAKSAGAHRPGIVHRLDKDTSGLLLVAKTDSAYSKLAALMRQRKIERTYLALVLGNPVSTTGRIEAPVGRLPRDRARMGISGARQAVTTFRVLRTFGDKACLLEVKLHTGRTHQIRVHMSHIGHPVVGDPAYGRKASNLAKAIGLNRPFLHASKLVFPHPFTKESVAVEEPLPEDLASALGNAERYAAQ